MSLRKFFPLALICAAPFGYAAPPDALPEVHQEEWKAMNASKAETMEWFNDSKFGMFNE